jgi:MFS family permease
VIDTVYRQFFVTLPLQLRALGHPPLAYGLLLTGSCLIIVLAEVPISVALGRRAATAVVAAGYALVGTAWLVLGAAPSLAGAIGCTVVLTAGEMLYKPTATATVADAAPEGYAGRYQSLYASASMGGMLLAPALGGLAWSHAPRLVFPVAGALGLLTALALGLHHARATRRTALPAAAGRP